MYTVAVIGSGPGGLMAAWQLSLCPEIEVHLFEKNEKLGEKIRVSGGGMCNYTQHATADLLMKHYGDGGPFLKHAFKQLDAFSTEALLGTIGIIPLIREDGKVFPASLQASQWIGAFERELRIRGVHIHKRSSIDHLERKSTGRWMAGGAGPWDAVVLATGGASYPRLGTRGDGYQILEALNLPIVAPKPALCGIRLLSPLAGLEGISVPRATLKILRGQHYIRMAGKYETDPSELLVTHKGLSGPLILNNSRWFENGDKLHINWSGQPTKVISDYLVEAANISGKRQVARVLKALALPQRLLEFLIQEAGIDGACTMGQLNKSQRALLVETTTAYGVEAFESLGWHQAMATKGGLALSSVNQKTMAVRDQPGLYVVGELLDIDGDTGGYNIQAALTTGFVAAKAIIKSLTSH